MSDHFVRSIQTGQIDQKYLFDFIFETSCPKDFLETVDDAFITLFWKVVDDCLKSFVVTARVTNSFTPDSLRNCEGVVVWIKDYTHFQPPSFFDALLTLCSILTISNVKESVFVALKYNISNICLGWWKNNVEGSERFMTYLIPYLLLLCSEHAAKESDYKRLWEVRGGFMLLDFQHPASSPLKDLILECFKSSKGIVKKERKKVLQFFMTLERGVVLQYIWSSIKLLILTAKGSIVPNFFGCILLSVWRKESHADGGDELSLLIEDMIQELLQQAIHSPKTTHFNLLRACLASFVEGSRDSNIHAMLRRIYGPLLWRSLRSANALVRAQAAVLFFDVFPLHDPHGSAEDDDTLLQRQFDLFSALLMDDDHRVRANAASGGCHILSQHWDSLPQKTLRDILSHLIKKLSVDHSSVNVRLAVLRGLSYLIENQPLSHEVLRKLLPFLTNSIHDSSEKVRVEFLSLLLKVKHVRDMHFYEIVSCETLVAQLLVDAHRPLVCSALTTLLSNSFFPITSSTDGTGSSIGPTQVRRCIEFVKLNQSAAEVFYAHLYLHVTVGRLVKFVVIISSLLFDLRNKDSSKASEAIKLKRGRSSRETNSSNEENSLATWVLDGDIVFKDTLRRIVLWILLSLVVSDVSTESVQLLAKYFSAAALQQVIKHHLEESEPAVEAVLVWLRIASVIADLLKTVTGTSEHPAGAAILDGTSILRSISANTYGSVERISSTNRRRAVADSLVLSLCALNQEEELLYFIRDGFVVPLSKSDRSDLQFSADLLLSYTSRANEQGGLQTKQQLLGVYDSVKAMVVDLRHSKTPLNFEITNTVMLVFQTWCSQTLCNAIDCDESLLWISEVVFGARSEGERPVFGSEGLMGIALLALSDLLYLGTTDGSAVSAGLTWVTVLIKLVGDRELSSQQHNSVSRMKRAVVSPVCRLGCVLSDVLTSGNQIGLLSLARVTLQLLDVVSVQDDEDTQCLSNELIQKTLAALSETVALFKANEFDTLR